MLPARKIYRLYAPTTTRYLTNWFKFNVVCKFIHKLSVHFNGIIFLKMPVHLRPRPGRFA